jgi:hypothetical protein
VQGQGAGPRLAKDDGEEEEKVSHPPTQYTV